MTRPCSQCGADLELSETAREPARRVTVFVFYCAACRVVDRYMVDDAIVAEEPEAYS